jgi:F-type H+-transporting ATPase subunit c
MQMRKLMTGAAAFAVTSLTSVLAFAQEHAEAAGSSGLKWVGVGIGLGMAVLGGALGQSRAASAALEGISRNPNAADKVFVPMILGLAFMESLVLFAWLSITFLIK